jgi:hypothetical protein
MAEPRKPRAEEPPPVSLEQVNQTLLKVLSVLESMDRRLAKAEVLYDNPAMRWARGRKKAE